MANMPIRLARKSMAHSARVGMEAGVGSKGVTEFDAAEAELFPTLLVATTEQT